ncbi:Uncharacterized protein BM_BM4799 [Brugia malayi]|uniref:AAA+ ATPase domain-containing protein n=2 Tax=Brugia TaxID=6278 RepID=A0A0H5S7N0_BRUMA|nr:Uncharacterized protein BM_BM4799 [Brugia malayi]CRZ24373.1 BMA-MSPN-1 [Brugia malayi]VIO98652.1 Uncharacterized protein BM_BM4799 [Brugia malayi]
MSLSMDQALNFCIRVAVATVASIVIMKLAVRYIDPNHSINKNAKKKAAQVIKTLGLDPSIELNEYELRIATQFVHCGQGADWCDIGGCGAVIEEINDRIIIPLKIRNIYKKLALSSNLLSPPKGVLLYGPPGCGKTLLAKVIARAANARFINLQVSSLCDKWYGESQKLADAVFSVAQKFQPTIIFIDEIDSFLRDRNTQDHEATAMMKAQFMCLWDGFASSDDAIVVLGATNRPNDVDSAILRRMPARFYVPLPSLESRADILKVLLRDQPVMPDINFERIAEYANELSGSDLKEVCRLAVLSRVKDAFIKGKDLNNETTRMIRESDVIQSVMKYKQTIQVSGTIPVFEPLD